MQLLSMRGPLVKERSKNMKNVKLNNNHNSVAVSQTARQSLPPRSERNFLADQATYAKAAMIRSLHDMKETLTKAADVRSIAKQHPWLVMTSAVAAGFVTGAMLTPSPRKKRAKTQANSPRELPPTCQGQYAPQTKNAFLLSTIGTFLASIVQTVVRGWIVAAVVAREQRPIEALSPHDSTGADADKSRNDYRTDQDHSRAAACLDASTRKNRRR